MKTYPIVEIFHSVQGEGYHSGTSSIFVRFGNCNLKCEWCDTDFEEYEEKDLRTHIYENSDTYAGSDQKIKAALPKMDEGQKEIII